ncbi:MAG: mono/diheme cytochrome c family protein [Cocleimonas sp.]|jgi:mono/diheme cytochrome c family protein
MNKLIILGVVLGAVITMFYVFAEGKHEDGHGRNSSHGNAHSLSPRDAAARVNPIQGDQESLERGKQVFMMTCALCHGVTAKGDGPVGVNLIPKPTDLTIMAGNHSDGDFEWKIANGRGDMPAWKTSLNQTQRWDVVNYIQALENPNGTSDMDHSNRSEQEIKAMMGQGSSDEKSPEDDHNKTEHAH